MAAGVPTVASDISGYRDVVTHGIDGLLSAPSDPTALADAIRTLIEDPDLRSQMGAAGKIKAHGYRWSEVATSVLDFYKQTAARPELSGIV
jgi:glycosyltransferase involved in cell wall biosynthesis